MAEIFTARECLFNRGRKDESGKSAGESGGFCEVCGVILGRRDADLIEAGLNEGAGRFARLGYGDCMFFLPPDRVV